VTIKRNREAGGLWFSFPIPVFLLVKLNICERYELKIDYITMDQVCTWSQY
jgi:hypothetical protein